MIAERSAARVALLADTFHEVNGAARTCREWEAFACRNDRPFLCVRWGASPGIRQEGSVRILEMARSRLSFRIDTDLRFDALFHRVLDPIHKELERFRPDAIHVTSPGDLGISGAILAERLKIPLVLSWHTNLHEFAGRRMRPMAAWLGDRASGFRGGQDRAVCAGPCVLVLRARRCHLRSQSRVGGRCSASALGKPVFPMVAGSTRVSFIHADAIATDDALVLGYVGRLMPEKNLRVLSQVADALRESGIANFRFQITGAGSERRWLQRNLPRPYFSGVLTGRAWRRRMPISTSSFSLRARTLSETWCRRRWPRVFPRSSWKLVGRDSLYATGSPALSRRTTGRFATGRPCWRADGEYGERCPPRRGARWKDKRGIGHSTRCMTDTPSSSNLCDNEPVWRALLQIVRHPWKVFVIHWNWKAAVLSAGIRGLLFCAAVLPHGCRDGARSLDRDRVSHFAGRLLGLRHASVCGVRARSGWLGTLGRSGAAGVRALVGICAP
ncbi:MAG: glycosyltransferase [Ignavibacteriota bacterium]